MRRTDEATYQAAKLLKEDAFQIPKTTVMPPPAPKTPGALGTQVGGSHYTDCKIQPIEYIWANNLGFSEGNIIKYVTRWRSKGGIKDLEKAKHHIALLIEHELAAANAAPRTSGL